jgi:hypothetical protein
MPRAREPIERDCGPGRCGPVRSASAHRGSRWRPPPARGILRAWPRRPRTACSSPMSGEATSTCAPRGTPSRPQSSSATGTASCAWRRRQSPSRIASSSLSSRCAPFPSSPSDASLHPQRRYRRERWIDCEACSDRNWRTWSTQLHVSYRTGGATVESEYGTFDPLTVAVFPRILVGATFLASNGGLVSGGRGRRRRAPVAGLLRFAPAHLAVVPARRFCGCRRSVRTSRVLSLSSLP